MLFTMKMTDAELKNFSYGFVEWFHEENERDLDYGEDCVEDLFDEYAEYLMNEVTTDDDELMTTMYAVVQYYGEEGYVFQDWYERRECDSADCVEYEEWKHAQPSADEFICSEEAKCTNDDNCKGCYGTDDEEEDIQKKIGDWLNDKNNNENDLVDFLIDECGVVIKEQKETGFGTAYHDGSGFADCDPEGNGNRLCSEYPKDKWCSECVYLNE